MDLETLKQKIPSVEECMKQYVENRVQSQRLKDSMQYSLEGKGKRIRPLLCLAMVDLFDYPITTDVIQVAAAIEMIHTYSLIHDDLPAMDDDDLRRGRLTNHKQFDEATAILAGDALLTDAFYLLSEVDLSAEKKVSLMGLLAKASGGQGMVAGQMKDIEAEQQSVDLESLEEIHVLKTGALITDALVSGLIIAQQLNFLNIVQDMGYHLGLAFQIRDDILDVVATTEEIGKTPHRDEALGKSTYPELLGLSGAYDALDKELDASLQDLQFLSEKDSSALKEIIDSLRLVKGV